MLAHQRPSLYQSLLCGFSPVGAKSFLVGLLGKGASLQPRSGTVGHALIVVMAALDTAATLCSTSNPIRARMSPHSRHTSTMITWRRIYSTFLSRGGRSAGERARR